MPKPALIVVLPGYYSSLAHWLQWVSVTKKGGGARGNVYTTVAWRWPLSPPVLPAVVSAGLNAPLHISLKIAIVPSSSFSIVSVLLWVQLTRMPGWTRHSLSYLNVTFWLQPSAADQCLFLLFFSHISKKIVSLGHLFMPLLIVIPG